MKLNNKEIRILKALVRSQAGDQFNRVYQELEKKRPERAKKHNLYAHSLMNLWEKLDRCSGLAVNSIGLEKEE